MYKQIVFALLLCYSITINAQVSVYGAAGINSTDVKLGESPDFITFYHKPYIQPFLTFGLAVPILQKFYCLAEFGYTSNGYKSSQSSTKFRYNILNFQTGVGYQFGSLKLEVGGFISKRLSDQIKTEWDDWHWMDNYPFTSKNYNAGIFAGLNLSIIKNFAVFARYYRGLTPISYRYYTCGFGGFPKFIPGKVPIFIQNLQFGISILIF